MNTLPGANLSTSRMPGHWLLARAGKRVLRPGGVEMTAKMLALLEIGETDRVVEFAPGLGDTARRIAKHTPFSYIGVDRDADAVGRLRQEFQTQDWMRFVQAPAEATELEGRSASVVIAEAMLSMQSAEAKDRVVREAARLLTAGGKYAIHELCLRDSARKATLEAALSREIHNGIRLLTRSDWRELLESHGFCVIKEFRAPMHLLEPARVIEDEGLCRTLRIVWNLARDPEARARVMAMRRVFAEHCDELEAICLISEKGELE